MSCHGLKIARSSVTMMTAVREMCITLVCVIRWPRSDQNGGCHCLHDGAAQYWQYLSLRSPATCPRNCKSNRIVPRCFIDMSNSCIWKWPASVTGCKSCTITKIPDKSWLQCDRNTNSQDGCHDLENRIGIAPKIYWDARDRIICGLVKQLTTRQKLGDLIGERSPH